MADFTDFTGIVSNFVPNVPPFVVAKAAQQCTQDFFGRTTEFREELTVTTVVGQRKYKLTPNTSDTFVNLVLCVVDDKDNAIAHSQLADQLTINPIPDRIQDLTVTVAICPTVEATEIPDQIYQRHVTALRFGTIAILKSQIGTEWYSPVEAANYMQMFEQEINQSKILRLTTNGSVAVNIPSFN